MKLLTITILLALSTTCAIPQVTYTLSTDKQTYSYGDDLFVTITAVNNGSTNDTLLFSSCLQADYIVDTFDWAYHRAWCQVVTNRLILPHDSTVWGVDYFRGYLESDSGSVPLSVGKHAIIGRVGRYWTSDTLWIEVEPLTGVPHQPTLPTEFALGNNFPNPFNPSTRIEFAIPRASPVTLKIFNVFGEETATLVQATLPAGRYTEEWNADPNPSGIYFCRLQAGSFVQTRKLVFIK